MLQRRLAEWATEPRTTIPQLHTALQFVLENEPDPEWDRFAVKYGYIEIMDAMERPIPSSAQREIEGEWTCRFGDMSLSAELIDGLEAARRFLLREPERSRRVLRLLCANYLAHVESRKQAPRRPAVWAMFSYLDSSVPITKRKIGVPLYPVSPEAPAGARAYHRRRWPAGWSQPSTPNCDSYGGMTNGCRRFKPGTEGQLRTAGRTATSLSCWPRRSIVASAASLPPSEEALVGTYLKSLPDDSSPEAADETPPIVE